MCRHTADFLFDKDTVLGAAIEEMLIREKDQQDAHYS
jgi:hypothetical protein